MARGKQHTIDPDLVRYWAELAERLAGAGRGERTALVEAARAANGLGSLDAVYRRLRQYGGWQSGRARRRDAGQMAISEEALDALAATYREGARADGRQIMTLETAASICAQSGHDLGVSNSQLGRYLRARRLDRTSQRQAEHFTELRSLHPNHVHQVDPSLCVLYYLRGEQHIIRESEFYRNKLERLAKIQEKCWRYVLTDHFSGFVAVRYYSQAGESQAAMFDFLMDVWGRSEGEVLHGLPEILMWDKGSANTAHGIQRLLEALEVRAIAHATERSNVKGQVEGAQLLVERGFESRLRYEPVADVAALNAAARHWEQGFNANLLPRIDSRLKRPGADPLVRTDLWLSIRAEQLRECPPRAVCARLLEGKPETRVVHSQALITYLHPAFGRSLRYSLKGIAEIHRGDEVRVAPLLVGEDGQAGLIRLRWTAPDGSERTWRVAPDLDLDAAGRPLDAAVIGEEHKANKKRDAERQGEHLDAIAYPRTPEERAAQSELDDKEHARRSRQKNVVPLAGKLDAISHLSQIEAPAYLPKRGTAVALAAPEDETPPVPIVRALARLREAWGRPITREESRWLRERYGEALPEAELERLLAAQPAAGEAPGAQGEGWR